MPDAKPVSLILRPLHVVGEAIPGLSWGPFLDQLAQLLGAEKAGGLLLARFATVAAAAEAWGAALAGPWQRSRGSAQGPCPVQGLLDLAEPAAGGPGLAEGAPLWNCLQPGWLHAPMSLRERPWVWGNGYSASSLNPVPGADEVGRLRWAGEPPSALNLLPARTSPWGSGGAPCFYCGRMGHGAATCPSKRLGPEVYELPAVARGSLRELDAACRAIAAAPDPYAQALERMDGGDGASSDPTLRTFIALLDLDRVYQLRFLWFLAFSKGAAPPESGPLGSVSVPGNHPLRLGLDCLRVGRLDEAARRLGDLPDAGEGLWFHTEVALAFVALEQGRSADVAYHLGRAARLGGTPLEKAYAHLLRSRHQEILGNLPGAELAVRAAAEAQGRWSEVAYRSFQLAFQRESGAVHRLNEFAASGPEAFARLLLDPRLDRADGRADSVLAALWESARRRAVAQFDRARFEGESLAEWLGPRGTDLSFVETSLGRIEAGLRRRSYGDDLDATAAGERLQMSLHLLKVNSLQRLREEWGRATEETARLERAWAGYPHPRWFRGFAEGLAAVRGGVREGQALLAQGSAPACRRAVELLREVQPKLRDLAGTLPDLAWVLSFLNGLREFGKRLVMAEVVALILGLGLPLFGLIWSAPGSWYHSLYARSPAAFRFWAVFLIVVGAPGWAAGAALRQAGAERCGEGTRPRSSAPRAAARLEPDAAAQPARPHGRQAPGGTIRRRGAGSVGRARGATAGR